MFKIKFRYDNEQYINGVWECPEDEEYPKQIYRFSYSRNNNKNSSWTGFVQTQDGMIEESNVFIKQSGSVFFAFGSNLFGRFVIKANLLIDNYWHGVKDYNITPILKKISCDELRNGFKRSRAMAFSLKRNQSSEGFNDYSCVTEGDDYENNVCLVRNHEIDFQKYMWLRHYNKRQRREFKINKENEERVRKIELENSIRLKEAFIAIKNQIQTIEEDMKNIILMKSNSFQSSISSFNKEKQKQVLIVSPVPIPIVSNSSSVKPNSSSKVPKIKKIKTLSKKKQNELDLQIKINETKIKHIKDLMSVYNKEGNDLTNEDKIQIKKSYLDLKPPSKQILLKYMFENKKNCPFGVLQTSIDFDFLTNDGYFWLRESIGLIYTVLI